jgi:hypothetical protein
VKKEWKEWKEGKEGKEGRVKKHFLFSILNLSFVIEEKPISLISSNVK